MHLTTEENLALQLRRRSFQLALADLRVQGALLTADPHFADCPCCGYPTIGFRRDYDICAICGWEDDGQDDPEADAVWGGPNYDYSLTEARRNFIDGRTQYRPADPHFERKQRTAKEREALIAAYDALLPDVHPWSFIAALPEIGALKTAVSAASFGKRRVRRWSEERNAPRHRADLIWNNWRAIASGTLPRWNTFPPSVFKHHVAVFTTIADRVDAIVQRRLGIESPVPVIRGTICRSWSRGELSAWILRADYPPKIVLQLDPGAEPSSERVFDPSDDDMPAKIADLIVTHFTATAPG